MANLDPNNNSNYNETKVNIDILKSILRFHCANNGKELVYEQMKHSRGWAVDFCKRHNFEPFVRTVKGSSRSKSRFQKYCGQADNLTQPRGAGSSKRQRLSSQDCVFSTITGSNNGNHNCDSLCVAYVLLDLKTKFN